jgi:hypothetical protein
VVLDIKYIYFFVLHINFKLSDDFFKKKIKISRPNGENWFMENFEIFSAKTNFLGF